MARELGFPYKTVDRNLVLLLQTPQLSRVRAGPINRLVLDQSFCGRFPSETQKELVRRAIALTFDHALAEVSADPLDFVEKHDRYVWWLNILPKINNNLGRWCRQEWYWTWQASIHRLSEAIRDMLLESQLYSRWYILLPSEMLFFELIQGTVRLDKTAQTKLLQIMDYQSAEFNNGFLHLRNRSSHLDFQAFLHAGLPPEMQPTESIGYGQCFIETFLGRLYFTIDPSGQIQAAAAGREVFLLLGPLAGLDVITMNGRRWLRLIRTALHPAREYLIQTSTL